MLQSAIWLGDLLESYGGEFVHNPRVNDEYDGRIHTPAGWFVHRFLMLCDSRITETNAANIMAAAVKFRNRRGQHRS